MSFRTAILPLCGLGMLLAAADASATSLRYQIDPLVSEIRFDALGSGPLHGSLLLEPLDLTVCPFQCFQIRDIALRGVRRQILGPEELEFEGATTLIRTLPVVRPQDPLTPLDLFVRTNVERVDVDGDRVLFRWLDLRAADVTAGGADASGFPVLIGAEGEIVQTLQWYEVQSFPLPNPQFPISFPTYLAARELVSDDTIGAFSLRARSVPGVPEPGAVTVFALGLALIAVTFGPRRMHRRSRP